MWYNIHMQFSDTSTNQGLIQDCEFWVFGGDYGRITGNTELLEKFTRLVNLGLDMTSLKIMNADWRWQWDDSNHTDFPIATTALNSGQQDYELEFSTDSHLKIERVEVKDETGQWRRLKPLDLADTDYAQAELYDTNGDPVFYDKFGNSIFLYPAPDYTQAASLKIFYQREPSYFTTSDTTKKPGIPSPFHRLISLYACKDYTLANSMFDKAQFIEREVVKMENELQKFFQRRDKEDVIKLTGKVYSSR